MTLAIDQLSGYQICSICVASLILVFYLPLSLYGTYQFWKNRNHAIIQKRYPQITFAANFTLILVIICEGLRGPAKSFKQQCVLLIIAHLVHIYYAKIVLLCTNDYDQMAVVVLPSSNSRLCHYGVSGDSSIVSQLFRYQICECHNIIRMEIHFEPTQSRNQLVHTQTPSIWHITILVSSSWNSHHI